MIRPLRYVAGGAIAVVAIVACSSPSDPPSLSCVSGLSTSCAASYDPPAYDTIFAKILQPNCATGKGTCHTGDAREGGLAFVTADESYGLLVGSAGGKARVKPGDPSCSEVVERLTTSESSLHMPQGPTSLSAPDQCTIVKSIAAGAAR